MRLPIDNLVLTSGNREAFEAVIGVTQRQDVPVDIYLRGPDGSGKSAVLRARAEQRDLLSKRKVMLTHAAELASAVELGSDDRFLEDVGSVDVLLIDSLDDFFECGDSAIEICGLLLKERASRSLSTAIAGRRPLEDYESALPGDELRAFEEFSVAPLLGNDLIVFAENVQDKYRDGVSHAPVLSDEALSFVALDFAESLSDIDNAIHYLTRAAGLEKDSVVDKEIACRLLEA